MNQPVRPAGAEEAHREVVEQGAAILAQDGEARFSGRVTELAGDLGEHLVPGSLNEIASAIAAKRSL